MLSIIVPIYKIEDYLPQCIESIIAQNYSEFELILVDDGSPDGCPEICDEYAKRDSRIKVLHKVNGGLVSARKAGLQIAQGEYIGYVDGDDWIESDFYERLMEKAEENNADIVASGFIKDMVDSCTLKRNSLECGYYSKNDIVNRIIPKMMFDDNSFEPGLFTYVWNKVFKRTVLLEPQMNVPDSISLGEDSACVYPAVLRADSLYITDDCLYHYRQRADSMLKISESYKEDYAGYKLLYRHLKKSFQNQAELQKETDIFLLYLISTRCGGVFFENDTTVFYLFDKQPCGKRLAIYGAGTLGQHLYKRLVPILEYNVVKWVDIDYDVLRTHGLPVDSPETVFSSDFDSILIAFLDANIVKSVKQILVNRGISEEKVFSADFLSVDCRNILTHLGVIEND